MSKCLRVAASALLLTASSFAGTIIHVPANQPTIQAGINAASNGDTVLVAPGTYTENITFLGKAITVKSSNGRAITTIASGGIGAIVTFSNGEGAGSILTGFTLSGALDTYGIQINHASPTIVNNTITGNHSCDGAGININVGSPVVKGNIITGNLHDRCSGGAGGGGIFFGGPGSPQIVGNVISKNNGGNGVAGGGIVLGYGGNPSVMNNIIYGNSEQWAGGGIGVFNGSNPFIVQNLIYNNTAYQGSGIYLAVPSGSAPLLVNNTVVAGAGLHREQQYSSAASITKYSFTTICSSA